VKRFAIPFIIASIVHVVFIWGNIGFYKKEPILMQQMQFMTMNISHFEASVKAVQPPEKVRKQKKKVTKVKKTIVEKKQKVITKKKLLAKTEEKQERPVEEKNEYIIKDSKGITADVKKASPLYSFNPLPHYPKSARKRGWQGIVEIEVVVDIHGSVKSLKIVKTSGNSVLDKSALKSLKNWRFSPGKQGGKTIESSVIVPVIFSLS